MSVNLATGCSRAATLQAMPSCSVTTSRDLGGSNFADALTGDANANSLTGRTAMIRSTVAAETTAYT